MTLTVTRIGNSRGVRLPARVLRHYGIGTTVLMEERDDGILLRPVGSSVTKLSWAQTLREMANAAEDWSEWDTASADGLGVAAWPEQSRAPRTGSRRRT